MMAGNYLVWTQPIVCLSLREVLPSVLSASVTPLNLGYWVLSDPGDDDTIPLFAYRLTNNNS